MQLIGTLSLTQHVKDWLGNSSHPRILHVFDRACNLINEHGEVLSIVTPQIGIGPFNLVLEKDVLFLGYFNIESQISISADRLTFGELVIDTSNAELWNPCPDWERLHGNRAHIVHQLTKFPIPDTPLPTSLISNFSFALAKADISSIANIASKLAGLGIGLTPAGDDFMMGALYAAWIIHPSNVARMLAEEIAKTAASLTTSLSAEWLRAAGRGETGILWHEYFHALITSDSVRIQSTVDDILAVGATSGADALAGFTSTFMAHTEIEKKHVIPKFI